MKKLLLFTGLGLTLAGLQPAAAQYYMLPYASPRQNPGNLNQDGEGRYDLGQPGWNLLLTGTAATQAAPVWSAVQTLPFAFQLGGQVVSSYQVSSSGVLTFSTGVVPGSPTAAPVPPTLNAALPSADVPDKSVCLWGTLMTASTDFLLSKTFGTAPNRQHWVQFNSVSLPQGATSNPIAGSFFYASIVLEETTNKVYLVWQRSGADAQTLTAGVQLNATTAYQTAASPNASILNLGSVAPNDNQYFEFAPGTQPALDLAGNYLTVPNIAARNGSVSIRGVFSNVGTQTVTSLTANYRVNNGPVVSAPLTGVSIASLDTGAFVHPTAFVPTVGGVLKVRAWMSRPNGGLDQQLANDTMRTTFVVGDSTMRRKVVEEDFTSSTCPPCRGGNINTRGINTQATNRGKFVEIKYQQDFPGPLANADPYYTPEGVSRRGLYGINAIPYMMLDGGWNENSIVYTAAILNQFQARPALARISGTYALGAASVLTATAAVKPLFAIPAGRLVAHMVVTERETRLNVRTNGETRFYDVMKKMLPNASGTLLPALASGQAFSISQTFNAASLPTTQAVEHFDSLRVVVFVQDVVTKEVYQGEELTLLQRPTATRRAQSGPAFALVPNPAAGRSTVELTLARPATVRVDVLDGLGRVVLARPAQALAAGNQQVALDLSRQAAGLDTVRLTSEQGVSTQKLTLE